MTYGICNQLNENLFTKQCEALEKNMPGLDKGQLLIDVDDSKIQLYTYKRAKIKVVNSYYTNDLYVESEIELTEFFK